MVFLIEYDRSRRQIVRMTEFQDSRRRDAESARLEIELRLNREGIDCEIVLLDAGSKEALRRTHGRYFDEIEWPEGDLPDQVGRPRDA